MGERSEPPRNPPQESPARLGSCSSWSRLSSSLHICGVYYLPALNHDENGIKTMASAQQQDEGRILDGSSLVSLKQSGEGRMTDVISTPALDFTSIRGKILHLLHLAHDSRHLSTISSTQWYRIQRSNEYSEPSNSTPFIPSPQTNRRRSKVLSRLLMLSASGWSLELLERRIHNWGQRCFYNHMDRLCRRRRCDSR